MRKVHFSDRPLPLTISTCIKPGLNQTELLSVEYEIDMFFTYGISHNNSTLVGWGGHTEDGNITYNIVSALEGRLSTWSSPMGEVVESMMIIREASNIYTVG